MATYKLISSYTVGAGGINTITFSSIPQTYTDLVLVWSLRGSQPGGVINVSLRLNGVSTTSYRTKMVRAYAGATSYYQATADSYDLNYANPSDSTGFTFASSEYRFFDYTNPSQKKSANTTGILVNAVSSSYSHFNWCSYSNHSIDSEITSISLANGVGETWVQYSTASLYGISKA